jgi:hypothetical protein
MRSTAAVRPNMGIQEPLMNRRTCWSGVSCELKWSGPTADLLLASDASLAAESKKNGQYFRTSQAMWWAWEDLNLRPHPYQQPRAYRYATLRFCRSRSTVEAK